MAATEILYRLYGIQSCTEHVRCGLPERMNVRVVFGMYSAILRPVIWRTLAGGSGQAEGLQGIG